MKTIALLLKLFAHSPAAHVADADESAFDEPCLSGPDAVRTEQLRKLLERDDDGADLDLTAPPPARLDLDR
ncbi:MAG TPA: hypothetical protein VN894_18045 [Polyangiaceae bacterium]|nr:hypothetical protein [Polyangiaceae bacterium]